eukprot:TRINITY_DN57933_c0_g1_i1.p1 TRINITY_DN57933_c0_g1~~TRINITY_DN57933_c0_g1_i1.p1  ORF type:complete len:597 (+),score=160.83 TRINITY_DN57933_c0_g1_i1:80-1870(+)
MALRPTKTSAFGSSASPDPNMDDVARRNNELKGVLAEHEDSLSRTVDDLTAYIRTWRNDITKSRGSSHAHLRSFAEHFKWAQPCGFDLAALVHDFALSIPTSRLDALGVTAGAPTPHVPNAEDCRSIVDRLLGRGTRDRSTGTSSHAVLSALCGRDAADASGSTDRLGSSGGTGRHFNSPLADRLGAALGKLSEIGGEEALKAVKEKLEESAADIAALRREADAAASERTAAIEVEDFSRAEARQVDEVRCLERLLVLLRDRLQEAMMGAADSGTHRSALDAAAGAVAAVLHDLATSSEAAAQDVATDLETMRVKGAAEEARHADAGTAFVDWYNDAVRQVDSTEREMDGTIEQIEALVAHLEKLGLVRHRLVNEVVVEVEREARRRAYYDEYAGVAAQHARSLAALQQSLNATVRSAVEMRRSLDRFMEGERHGGPDSDVRDLQVHEVREILRTFRRYSLAAGDLLERKERRGKGIEKMLRQLQFQVSIARDALDPDVPQYRSQYDNLSQTRRAVVEAVEELRAALDQQYELYLGVVALCPRLGEAIPPDPTAELRDVAVRDRSRFLAINRDFQTVEESALEAEVSALRQLSGQP